MVNCDSCLNSRPIISENGWHSVCCLSDKKATECLITGKYFILYPFVKFFEEKENDLHSNN